MHFDLECSSSKKDNTADNLTPEKISTLSLLTTTDTTLKIINVYVHIIRRDDGSGGLTDNQVNSWMSLFHNDYCLHKILINEIGRSGLNNTTFYNGITDNIYSTLINTDTHYNAIDVYLLSPTDSYSRASGIPGIALAVGGNYQGTSVLSHEFGHCLGLYHTHSGRGCKDFDNCAENIDGSNCSTCGDLVCDTPADPCLSGNVDVNCNYIGDPSFTPDVHNIMSYAPPTCLNRLTVRQTMRIHASIFNNSYIFNSRSPEANISGPSANVVCSSGATFSVENLSAGCTVGSWNKSDNLELHSTSGNTAIFKAKTGANSWGWVSATVNSPSCGSVTLSPYNIWVGVPQITNLKVDGSYYTIGKQICPGNHWLDVTPVGTGAGNATWTVPYGIPYYVGYNTLDFTFPSSLYSISISARSSNSCGTSSSANFYLTKKTYGCSKSLVFTIYPNPASDNITVTINDDPSLVSVDNTEFSNVELNKAIESNNYTIKIYNRQSALLSTLTRSGKSFNVPLSNLRDGTYIIEVNDGKNSYSQQLIVKHN